MSVSNLFDDLKKALGDFKKFLDTNVPTIKPAIQALRSVIPQITELLNQLIGLMGNLDTEIQRLNVNAVPGLDKVATFTSSVKTLLETSKNLLPDQAGTIDDVLGVVDVVNGLTSFTDVIKEEIHALITAIIRHLDTLKS